MIKLGTQRTPDKLDVLGNGDITHINTFKW